jgi:hypothetical protein
VIAPRPPAMTAGPRLELDLWHPTAVPCGHLALGRAAAGSENDDQCDEVDVVVIAPAGDEMGREWLNRSIETTMERLALDGVVWVVVPRLRRRAAERALRRAGLVLLEGILTIPRWPGVTHLIPIAPAALSDAGTRHLGLAPGAAWLAGALARLRPTRVLLRRGAPNCALLAARRPPPDPLRWLGRLDGGRAATASVVCGARADARLAVILRYPPSAHSPDLVAKIAFDEAGRTRLEREHRALALLRGQAARAGAEVPQPREVHASWLLVTDALAGRPAAAVLGRRPRRLYPIAAMTTAWLTTWNRATASTSPATVKFLDAVLLGPAERLLAAGVPIADYRDELLSLARRIQGRPIVLVAAHNDLTMANVLDAGDRIGVFDWEEATPLGLPLTDHWYALADAVSRTRRVTHVEAVEALTLGGPPALAVAPGELATALGLAVDQAELGFHACWLHHAVSELRRGEQGERFLAIVRAVASGAVRWPSPRSGIPG